MSCYCTGACRRYGTCSGLPPVGYWGAWPDWTSGPSLGCVCPPTSEQTCQSQLCPRKALQGVITSGPAHNTDAA